MLDFMKQVIYDRYIEYRSLPRFMVAHSMGGLITIHTAMRCKISSNPAHQLKGIILSSPSLRTNPPTQPLALRMVAFLIDYLWPKAKLVSFPPHPSTSFKQVKLHANLDPLNPHQPVRVHQGLELVRGITDAHKYAHGFDIPILIFQGLLDRHVDIAGTHLFFDAIASEDKTFIEMQDIMHEPWQEEREIREPIINAAVMWAVDRLDGKSENKFDLALQSFSIKFRRL